MWPLLCEGASRARCPVFGLVSFERFALHWLVFVGRRRLGFVTYGWHSSVVGFGRGNSRFRVVIEMLGDPAVETIGLAQIYRCASSSPAYHARLRLADLLRCAWLNDQLSG